MIAAAFLLLLAAEAPPVAKPNGSDELLDQALECAVYLDIAKGVNADHADAVSAILKARQYWNDRSAAIAREAGMSAKVLELRRLLIEPKVKSYDQVLARCRGMTPPEALH